MTEPEVGGVETINRVDTVASRRMTLGAAILVAVQIAIGMVVNLYVKVPKQHPGAHPRNYFSGSFNSVTWAIGNGAISLAIHAMFGIALVVIDPHSARIFLWDNLHDRLTIRDRHG